jgi:hypothetical protein
MDLFKQTRFIERLQFFDGQRLFAPDLQGLDAFNREMRWLHNRSLHQPGIGNGFAVSGKKGEREVRIGPGYAIDRDGREIVLLQDQVEPIPPVAGNQDGSPVLFDLTVSYPSDDNLEEVETRQGICAQAGAVRLKEEPIFCWIELGADGQPKDALIKQDILNGVRIRLGRAEVLNCQLNKDVSIAQRLNARPPAQPYICCADVEPDWQPWIIAPIDPVSFFASAGGEPVFRTLISALTFLPATFPVGLTAVIDTSHCGFLTTPCYSVRIVGPRVRRQTISVEVNEVNRNLDLYFIIDGQVQITDPRPGRFTLFVLLIGQMLLTGREAPADASFIGASAINVLKATDPNSPQFQQQLKALVDRLFSYSFDPKTGVETGWKVAWMGVEE